MNINLSLLDKISMFYIVLPLFIFLIGFLNIPFMILSCVFLFAILKFYFNTLKSRTLNIDKKLILLMIVLSALWCYSSGIGGFVFQNSDWHMRNALFRDLINFSYPVFYDNGSALAYYIAIFLPGALVGKLVVFFGGTQNLAFELANIFNYLYCFLGIFLLFIQITFYLNVNKIKYFWAFFVVIFFSGLDIFLPHTTYNLHIEWHWVFQYSSNTTLLFWVYNQTIMPWLLTILFLRRHKQVQNYGVYAILMFFNAPLPFLGLAIYMIFSALYNLAIRVKTKYLKKYLKNMFSLQNIISVLFLLPIIYFYYRSNDAALTDAIVFKYERLFFWGYYAFIFLEGCVYLGGIIDKYKNNVIYIITVGTLLILPLFTFESQADLVMRVSIPALFILMLFVIKCLMDRKQLFHLKIYLVILLIIGMITPCLEFYRTVYFTLKLPQEYIRRDAIRTLNNKITNKFSREYLTEKDPFPTLGNYKNYGTNIPNEKIFFKYFAKQRK